MFDENSCVITGNFVKDPVLKSTEQSSVVSFTLGVTLPKSKDSKESHYLDFEAWDTGAETINKYAKKGDKIIVFCTARQNKWKDAEGQNRSRIVFRVNKFKLLDHKSSKAKDLVDDNNSTETEDTPF